MLRVCYTYSYAVRRVSSASTTKWLVDHSSSMAIPFLFCAGMQGLYACRCQRADVRPGADDRTGSGNRLDRQRLHCADACGELGPCGHRRRVGRGGRGYVFHGSTWPNGSRLGPDCSPSQGGGNSGASDGERDSLPQVNDVAVVDPPTLTQNVKCGPLRHTAHGECALVLFSPVVAASNLFCDFFFKCTYSVCTYGDGVPMQRSLNTTYLVRPTC